MLNIKNVLKEANFVGLVKASFQNYIKVENANFVDITFYKFCRIHL